MQEQSNNPAYQTALNALLAVRPATAEEKVELDGIIANVLRLSTRCNQFASLPQMPIQQTHTTQVYPQAAAQPPTPPIADQQVETESHKRYVGVSASELAAIHLQETGEKFRMKELVEAIKERGYKFETENPETSLLTAMERRAGNFGDVIRVDRGLWAAVECLSEKELKSARHRERTKKGLAARKASGKTFGPPKKLTEVQLKKFREMARSDVPKKEICELFDISARSFANYCGQFGIDRAPERRKSNGVAAKEAHVLKFSRRDEGTTNEEGSSVESDEPSQSNGAVGWNPT